MNYNSSLIALVYDCQVLPTKATIALVAVITAWHFRLDILRVMVTVIVSLGVIMNHLRPEWDDNDSYVDNKNGMIMKSSLDNRNGIEKDQQLPTIGKACNTEGTAWAKLETI